MNKNRNADASFTLGAIWVLSTALWGGAKLFLAPQESVTTVMQYGFLAVSVPFILWLISRGN